MPGQLQTMLAAEKPDLFWQLVSALSWLYLAHMFVCLSLACQGPVITLIGEPDLRQEVCGGKCWNLWWAEISLPPLEPILVSASSNAVFCHFVFSPQVLSREPKVNAQHMSWFAKSFFFLIQRWQQAKNRSFEGHIMAAKQTTKKKIKIKTACYSKNLTCRGRICKNLTIFFFMGV